MRFDALVDPAADTAWTFSELDRLTEAARRLAGPNASESDRLRAVRTTIYHAGPWNDGRPFAYDCSDPDGIRLSNSLLHNYLERRLGQCVSMPILFLIIGERLGLKVALAEAPNHLFVRFKAVDGAVWNLETTSGAFPARLEWFRKNMPMTDRALETGLYMRSLPKRQAIAVMANVVGETLSETKRWSEALAIYEAILRVTPQSTALVAAGSIYGRLLREEFEMRHPTSFLIPDRLRLRRLVLIERNNSLLYAAEQLGWQPKNPEM